MGNADSHADDYANGDNILGFFIYMNNMNNTPKTSLPQFIIVQSRL